MKKNKKNDPPKKKAMSTKTLVMYALLTAIVVVLQYLGSFIKFGPFSISLVMIPVVIGGALCGPYAGAWLGFVGALVVLQRDSGPFLAVNVLGTIATVLFKGVLSGYIAGVAYYFLKRFHVTVATFTAAFLGSFINTSIFFLGCLLFFMDEIAKWANGGSAIKYLLFGMIGGNFIAELLINIVVCPVIVRLIQLYTKGKQSQ